MKSFSFSKLIFLRTLLLGTASLVAALLISVSAQAKNKSADVVKKSTETPTLTWAESKTELLKLVEKFQDPKKNKDARGNLLPETNEKLSDTQDLKLTGADKAEQIHTIISLISATAEFDLANSNEDTIYFDYKENKNAYLLEINKLSSKKKIETILEAFKALEILEIDLQKNPEE